jgi:ribosomal protein S18 acetylase RimI-like enzyme
VIDVRPATLADTPALAAMLGRAFADDPFYHWLLRSPATRDRYATRFFVWQLRRLLAQEQVTMTSDGAAVALWALPGRWRESAREALVLFAGVAPAMVRYMPSVVRGLNQVDRRHPTEPHLYLALLGCDPPLQGQGRGGAALAPGLALADGEGLPAYLETSKERNLAFYARFGFRVVDEVHMPRGGPTLWLMWREAR